MIIEAIKNIKSGRSDLRKFGITVGIVLVVLGGLFLWRGRDTYSYFFILSAAFLLLGLVVPILLKPIHKVWMTLAVLLGWLMTRVILCILFYLVFTPIGLISRLFGKQFIDLKLYKSQGSYWIYRELKEFKENYYERQF